MSQATFKNPEPLGIARQSSAAVITKTGDTILPSERSYASINKDIKAFPSLGSQSLDHTLPDDETQDYTWAVFKHDFFKTSDESIGGYLGRMATQGHTIPDAFLTSAASGIGQVMLACPNALYQAGLVSGSILMGFCLSLACWTMFILSVMYLERKKAKLADGTWKDHLQHVTQYNEVVGFHLGRFWSVAVQVSQCLAFFGTAVAQIVASATNIYSILPHYPKRTYELIMGGILCFFIFLPTFRHLRILNIVALVGTTTTAIFAMVSAGQQGFGDIKQVNLWPIWDPTHKQDPAERFFTGSATLIGSLGGHGIVFEMMDAMTQPSKYMTAFYFGQAWSVFLVVPHSILVVLAWPIKIRTNENMFGLLPLSTTKRACVWMMIAHQMAAFTYYGTPLVFYWEKWIGTHTRAMPLRLASRIPVALLIWFVAVAFPFYGAINSFMSAVNAPWVAFAVPALAFNWMYRTQERRENAILKPPKWALPYGSYVPLFILNWALFIIFGGFGFASTAYSIKSIVTEAKYFGVFARCYGC